MKRFLSFIPAIIWAVIVAWLSLIPASNFPEWWFFDLIHVDKWVHITMYSILSILLVAGTFRFAKTFPSGATQLWLATMATSYGILMEICQELFTTTRHFEWGDIAADTVGALLGVILVQYGKKKKVFFSKA